MHCFHRVILDCTFGLLVPNMVILYVDMLGLLFAVASLDQLQGSLVVTSDLDCCRWVWDGWPLWNGQKHILEKPSDAYGFLDSIRGSNILCL